VGGSGAKILILGHPVAAVGSVSLGRGERGFARVAALVTAPPPESPTDQTLLEKARAPGESGAEAFRALFARYKDEVFVFLVRLLRDRTLAEDVLQESFFRLHLHLEGLDGARPLRPWLYQIARHAALDALRVRDKETRLAAKARAGEAPPDAADEAARREAIALTAGALESLPGETRALLIQRHGLDMKLEDLAESFSINERTVRTRLARAAEELARALIERREAGEKGGRA